MKCTSTFPIASRKVTDSVVIFHLRFFATKINKNQQISITEDMQNM